MNGYRYLLLVLCTISMTFIYCNRVVFGFSVICQQPDNMTLADPDYYLTDSRNVAWLFTSTAIGMCLGPLPLYFPQFFGVRALIIVYSALCVISSLTYPLCDSLGFWPACINRFFAGFAQASQLHFTNDLVLRWTPESEAAFFFAIMLSTSQFGPLITMVVGGEACSTSWLGWESTYYMIAAGSFISSAFFCYFYTETVQENKYCSQEEKDLILKGKTVQKKKEPAPQSSDHFFLSAKVFTESIWTDFTIWISFIMFIGYYFGMIVYQQYSPIFIKQVLHFTIRETGYFSAIPQIIAIVIKIGGGKLLDHGFGLSPRLTLIIPLLVLEGLSGLSIFMTGFLENRVIALACLVSFASLHFFVPVICVRTMQIRAKQHSPYVLNANMIIAGVSQIVIPSIVQALAPENTRFQWSMVFFSITALIAITTLAYSFSAKIKPASWTKELPKTMVFPNDKSIRKHSQT